MQHRFGGSDSGCEFGSAEFCERCAAKGVELLEFAVAANAIETLTFGFSEEYCEVPARVLGGRKRAVYWFFLDRRGRTPVIRGGAGDDIPSACLALPGFHIAAQWGLIAHPSGMIYGREGQAQRSRDAKRLDDALDAAGYPPPAAFVDIARSKPNGAPRPSDIQITSFPADIGAALRDSADGPGLHNAGALIMKASPETARLPMTALGVPILEQMSRAQRDAFLQLLNRRRPPAAAL
jgi:hypothetical protein